MMLLLIYFVIGVIVSAIISGTNYYDNDIGIEVLAVTSIILWPAELIIFAVIWVYIWLDERKRIK
jgi:hypothetical protein